MVTGSITELNTNTDQVVTTRVVLTVEYDGSGYHGFQLQAGLPTVQDEIEKALARLIGVSTRVSAASRTDTGVHARGQVVSFRTEADYALSTYVNGLNYYLPYDIAVKEAHRVADSFSVRRDAVSREYSYHILNSSVRSPLAEGLAYRVPGYLDIAAMNRACQILVGQHDFASFASRIGGQMRSTVRCVHGAQVERNGEWIVFNISAGSFLPHQVRNTVGVLIRIGQGKMSIDQFGELMVTRKPGLVGPTAPACGLYLMRVNYKRPLEEET